MFEVAELELIVGTALRGSTVLARAEQHALSVQVRNGHPLAPRGYGETGLVG
jgi:hypothetical protein